MNWSRHASQRWAERFPGINWEDVLTRAKRPGHKARKKIRQLAPNHAHENTGSFDHGKYLLWSRRDGVVFVIATEPVEIVVTVFPTEYR